MATFLDLITYIGVCFIDRHFTKLNSEIIKRLWVNKRIDAYWQCDSRRDIVMLLQVGLTILSLIMAFCKDYSRSVSMIFLVLLGDVLLWHYVWKIDRQ